MKQEEFFSLLSGILHLGNIEFEGDEAVRWITRQTLFQLAYSILHSSFSHLFQAAIVDKEHLQVVCDLLQVYGGMFLEMLF